MRRWAGLILGAILILAADPLAAKTPFTKLGRGLSNVVLSPLEISTNMGKAAQRRESFGDGAWEGFASGLFYSVLRFATGLYDVVTFPVPLPWDYEPIMKPDYLLDEWHKTFPAIRKKL